MIFVIDNYDSFTYNLVDILNRYTEVKVFRNNEASPDELLAQNPDGILISPGPGRPEDSGISPSLAKKALGEIPILGICLGHQLLGQLLGMKLIHAQLPMHGKTSMIRHKGEGIFQNIESPLCVMRYHSLILKEQTLPKTARIIAKTESDEIMALEYKEHLVYGLQFHPESILTEAGDQMVKNWLRLIGQ